MSSEHVGANTMKRLTIVLLVLGTTLAGGLARAGAVFAPPPVAVVAADAEDLVHHYLRGDWHGAGPLLQDVRRTVPEPATLMRSRHLPAAEVKRLGELVHRVAQLNKAEEDQMAAARAANQLWSLAVNVGAHYPTRLPSRVERLDNLGQALLIEARAGDAPARMRATTEELGDTWQALDPSVKAHGGASIAKSVKWALNGLKGAHEPAQWQRVAHAILDQVYLLESLYT